MKILPKSLILLAIAAFPMTALADRNDGRYDHFHDHVAGHGPVNQHSPITGWNYSHPSYQYDKPRYDYRYDQQRWNRGSLGSSVQSEIAHGVRSGELTPRELQEIQQRERDIERARYAYSADGHLSRSERDSLEDKIRDLHKDVEHNLNDGERQTTNRQWW